MEDELARLGSPDCYFHSIVDEMLPKRDLMVRELEALGMNPTVPEGGYFIMGDISNFGELMPRSAKFQKNRVGHEETNQYLDDFMTLCEDIFRC